MTTELIQTHEGRPQEYRPRYGSKRIVQVGRKWDVMIDGEKAGEVEYCMITRETRSKGKMYVNSRWQSPGWRGVSIDRAGKSRGFGYSRSISYTSRAEAVRAIEWQWHNRS